MVVIISRNDHVRPNPRYIVIFYKFMMGSGLFWIVLLFCLGLGNSSITQIEQIIQMDWDVMGMMI